MTLLSGGVTDRVFKYLTNLGGQQPEFSRQTRGHMCVHMHHAVINVSPAGLIDISLQQHVAEEDGESLWHKE